MHLPKFGNGLIPTFGNASSENLVTHLPNFFRGKHHLLSYGVGKINLIAEVNVASRGTVEWPGLSFGFFQWISRSEQQDRWFFGHVHFPVGSMRSSGVEMNRQSGWAEDWVRLNPSGRN
ncbi:hypothetical protein BBA71_11635 [Acetobacter pasteurianus]|nr:hypothetical protein BBA71_11635 [Acetobacter pasteurianus]